MSLTEEERKKIVSYRLEKANRMIIFHSFEILGYNRQ